MRAVVNKRHQENVPSAAARNYAEAEGFSK